MVNKKNTAIAGIAVLLCTALVFLGCEEAGSSAAVAPAVPENLIATAGEAQVVLTWTAVTGATSYKVYQDGTALDAAITEPTHTVTGLTAGRQYSFTVSAVSSAGESAQSAAATATPAAAITKPAAPSVTATPADGQVTLSWTAVAGAASYKVYQGTSDNEILTGSTITGTSAVVTGLTNVQPYSFWVAAVNSGGSTLSAEVTATPRAAGSPPATAPTGLSATAGVEEVVLAWTAVTGATSYKVYQDGTALTAAITMPTHTVTGLSSVQYSFTVSAVNGAGEGPQSSPAAMATPTPAVPAGLTAAIGNAQVVLTWTASSGNTGVTGYKIRTTGGIADVDISGRETATGTVTGLTNGTEYSFTIAAVAGSTQSAQSTAVMATPLAAPVVTASGSRQSGNTQLGCSCWCGKLCGVSGNKR